MPPRIPRGLVRLSKLSRSYAIINKPSICLFCSHTTNAQRKPSSKRRPTLSNPQLRLRASLSTDTAEPQLSRSTSTDPRDELRDSLRDLQKHAGRFLNLSRLQLALHGLQQEPGNESIRIALLGVSDGGKSVASAKQLLRLLLADPLKPEEEWERILLDDRQGGKPLLLKVGHHEVEERSGGGYLVQELPVSSPILNGHKLEILVLEMDPSTENGAKEFAEAVLVPSMEIPTSNTGRYTPITTPVHKSLIVGDGIRGAATLAGFPSSLDPEIVGRATNIQLTKEDKSLPFQIVDVSKGSAALESFRSSIDNALKYEHDWFSSNVPQLVEWIKAGTSPAEGEMKEPLRKLIASLLERAISAVEAEEASKLSDILSSKISSVDISSLRQGLSEWAENAHTELRDQLDIAFDGRRWSKLSWWKLFWRVDDVSMIASDILSRRFLTRADEEIIFLAGQIAQVQGLEKITSSAENGAYVPVVKASQPYILLGQPPPPNLIDLTRPRDLIEQEKPKPWPTHITATRRYLSLDTIPALQALAQKLVLQTLTTSSFASIFAGLIYVSTLTTTLYEAGAVAALGIVWSMRRMQGKWETARKFWEGEVREEGRKAVRAVEAAVVDVLNEKSDPIEADPELETAKEVIARAEDALARCK